MASDRDLRMAALRKNQKENFVGAEVKKARRVSELRSRQKEKRRSVWDQGREGLAELQEEDAKAAATIAEEDRGTNSDRKQMLMQWKKKRDEQVNKMKSRQLKPFKVGSRNAGAPVPLPSVAAVSKSVPKPPSKVTTKPVPPNLSRRSVRASTRAQTVGAKENATKPATGKAAAAGRAGKGREKKAESKPLAPTQPTAAKTAPPGFTFQAVTSSVSLTVPSSDKFSNTFPAGEFSPFKFNFRKNLAVTKNQVTVRGQIAASSPRDLPTADSPALWPQTPGKSSASRNGLNDSKPMFSSGKKGRKSKKRASMATPQSCQSMKQQMTAISPRARPSTTVCAQTLSQLSLSPAHSNDDSSPGMADTVADGDVAVPGRSPPSQPPRASTPPAAQLSPVPFSTNMTVATHGEVSSAASTSNEEEMPISSPPSSTAVAVAVAVAVVVSAPFRATMNDTAAALNELADAWSVTADGVREELSEEILGRIDTAVGQARLLIRERFFKQFSKLCDGADDPSAERATHASDLQGFWEMISFQVDDVKQKFADLAVLKANNWQATSKTPKKAKAKRVAAKKKTPGKARAAARERMLQFRAAKKREAEAAAAVSNPEETSEAAPNGPMTPEHSSAAPEGSVAQTLQFSATKRTPKSARKSTPHSAKRSAKKVDPIPFTGDNVPAVACMSATRRMSLRQSVLLSAKKKTPKAMPVAEAFSSNITSANTTADKGFDFSQYIEPIAASATSSMAVQQSSWLASAMDGSSDLMAFSPVASNKVKAIGTASSPGGAFVRGLAPMTPSNRCRSQAVSIASLNNHVVVTPVRRSVRLLQTPGRDGGTVGTNAGGLPDLAEYSVWPNMALD